MIKLFDTAAKVLFFPKRWANSVTLWIQNVRSPDDSIKVTNTCSPKEGSSLGLTVNMQKIYDGVVKYFAKQWATPEQVENAIAEAADSTSIIAHDGVLSVDEDWVKNHGGGTVATSPLTVQCVTRKSGSSTVLDFWKVYLPNLTVRIGMTDYDVQTGSTTGYVTAIADEPGWYKMNGITTGNIYLVDCSTVTSGVTTFKAKFDNAELTTANTMCRFVASTTFADGAWTVNQFPGPAGGQFRIGDGIEHAKEYNTFFEKNEGGDSQSRIPSAYYLDPNGWKRDDTKTMDDETSGRSHTPTQIDGKFSGIRFQVVSRVVRSYDEDFFFWRWAYFDKNGMLIEVSPEQGVYSEMNYDNN